MRIAYLINQYPKVSHSFIRREILALEKRGIQIMRISLRGWDDHLVDKSDQREREKTLYVLSDGALPLLLAFFRVLVTHPLRFSSAFALALRMGWRGERPMPVHIIYLAEACRILGWLRAEHVQHLHAHFGTNSAEVAMLVHALGGPKWSFTVHGPKEFEKVAPLKLSEKLRRCAFAVAISSFGRSQLYRLLEYRNWSKIRVVHCGLDDAFLSVAPSPVPVAKNLVCVGRLCEQKGQLLLIEAARRLFAEGNTFNLVLAGDGEMRCEIEQLIALHNLGAQIRITGWITSEQVRAEIFSARALVLPSFAEGLPVVIMEAMALRRPVISTWVAGIPELVRNGETGWLIPAGDVDALVESMRAALDLPQKTLSQMGEAAYLRVRMQHDVDEQVAALAELFEHSATHTRKNTRA